MLRSAWLNHLTRFPRVLVAIAILASLPPGHAATWRDDSPVPRIEGFTEPYRHIQLAAGEPGVLAEVNVSEGARVEPGQIVARLDSRVLEQSLQIARERAESTGALRAAEAELQLQRTYLNQLLQLRERGHATQRELDRARSQVAVAEARVAMAESEQNVQRMECGLIEAQIERRVLRSPIRGIVCHIKRDAGEAFTVNDDFVLSVVQLDRLKVRLAVDPALVGDFTVGQEVSLNLERQPAAVAARVESIAPVTDAESSTVQITLVIENPDEAVPSGTRCWLQGRSPESPADHHTQYTGAGDSGR